MPKKRSEIELLYEISQSLGVTTELEEALSSLLKLLSLRLGMKRGTLTLLHEDTGEVEIESAYGLSRSQIERGKYKPGEGIIGRVVQSGQSVIVPRIAEEPLFLDRTGARQKIDKKNISFICVPILLRGKVVGTLSVDRLFSEAVSLDEDVRLLSVIAAMIAQAVASRRRVREEKKELMEENIRLLDELKEKFHPHNIIGNSRPIQEVYDLIRQVSQSNATVLLRGESGTGKELVADAIHYYSLRANKPMVKIHCSAIPETLLESELFGYEKGAFTGALQEKRGRFEIADGGTVFLDEIGDLSLNIQVKLLRLIQAKQFQRVGGLKDIKVDVRLIAATHVDLEKAIAEKGFREDLYYRLNIFPIYIPPLRERKSDIMLLADCFLEKYARLNKKEMKRISTPAIDMLMSYHWPGNVRELENCIERAVLLSRDNVVHGHYLPPSLQSALATSTSVSGNLSSLMEAYEKELLAEALKSSRGNVAKASRLLGTTLRIFSYRLRKHQLDPAKFKK